MKSWKSRRKYLSETRRSSIYYTAPFLAQSDAWYDISANFHALHAVSSSIASRHKVQLNSHMTRVCFCYYIHCRNVMYLYQTFIMQHTYQYPEKVNLQNGRNFFKTLPNNICLIITVHGWKMCLNFWRENYFSYEFQNSYF